MVGLLYVGVAFVVGDSSQSDVEVANDDHGGVGVGMLVDGVQGAWSFTSCESWGKIEGAYSDRISKF
jgi:hypothetical protein